MALSQYNYGAGQTPDDELKSSAPQPYMPNDATPTSQTVNNQAPKLSASSGGGTDIGGQLAQNSPTFAQQQAAGVARPPAPAPAAPGTTQNGNQTFINGPAGTSSGLLGQQMVPGSNGGMVDLGAGQFAPIDNSGNGQYFGAPHSVLGGTNDVTGQQYLEAGLYGSSAYDPSKAGFAAVYNSPTGLVFAPPGYDPSQLPAGAQLISGSAPGQGLPSAAGGGGLATSSPQAQSGDAQMATSSGSGLAPSASNDTSGALPGTSGALAGASGATGGGTYSATGGGSLGGGSSNYDLLNGLVNGAAGNGAGSQTQAATNSAVQNMLNNPSPYNQSQLQNFYNYAAGNIDDQYALQRKAVDNAMAARGLGSSSIHAGNLEDLNIGQRSALSQLANDQAQNYANTIGQYQANAIGLGNQVGNSAQNNQQSWMAQLMGFGQNAFNNDLATNQQNQQQQQAYQNYILGLVNAGYNG